MKRIAVVVLVAPALWAGTAFAQPLKVSSSGGTAQLTLEQTSPYDWARLTLGVTGGTSWTLSVGAGATPTLAFWNGSTNVMVVGHNGNVGIGTTLPQQRLHVAGLARFDVGGGSINVSTPGGNPGLIAFAANGHRRDIVCDNYGMRLLVGNSGSAPTTGIDVLEDGTTRVKALQIAGGADIAEPFEVAGSQARVKGTVMVIDDQHPGQLRMSQRGYDRCVAGVVSGAGGLNPGLTLSQAGVNDQGAPIALSGRVYALADATNGAIRPGDLLTTSDTPGHAMKVTDYPRAQGAVLGKAMSALDSGRGLVLVLVTLQ